MNREETIKLLESLRLLEQPIAYDEVSITTDKKKPSIFSNDPMLYSNQVPFLLYNEDGSTIISNTALAINTGEKNPFTTNWMEVTLYETEFVRELLKCINSEFISDVAEAIDDEDAAHQREDGPITEIISDYYGTGQQHAHYYSYSRENWRISDDHISAKTIAEGILQKRRKADIYSKKIEEKKKQKVTAFKKHLVTVTDEPESHVHIDIIEELQTKEDEIKKLIKERDEWKRKYEELINKEPEHAFNSKTGSVCFTNKQMGIFLRAIAEITEAPQPPGKTLLGEVVEKIAGYSATSVNQNLKGTTPEKDKEYVASAIESRLPKLAAKVRKL